MKKLNLLTIAFALILLLSGCSLPPQNAVDYGTMKLTDKSYDDYYFDGHVCGEITNSMMKSYIWEFISSIESQTPVVFDKHSCIGRGTPYITLTDKETGTEYQIYDGIFYETEFVDGGPGIFVIYGLPNENMNYTCYYQTYPFSDDAFYDILFNCIRTGTKKDPKNPVWNEASPETSALTFYTCNGKTITSQLLFNTAQIREIIILLSSSCGEPVENWTADDITLPIYGIEISKKNGTPLKAVWTNGMLILNDGTAYNFDHNCYDWEDKYDFENKHFNNTASLPCADYILKTGDGWNYDLMTEEQPRKQPDGIEIEIISISENEITAKFINNTDSEWTFGTYYQMQTEHNGKWYDIPTKSDMNYTFTSIAYTVLPHSESIEQTYSTEMYGKLPDGHYRLSTYSMTLEFDVSDNSIIL